MQLSAGVALGRSPAGKYLITAVRKTDFDTSDMDRFFSEPPTSAKPLTLWHWMNGLITKEGITADLESFKAAGLAGVQQFLVGGSEMKVDDPKNSIMSDNWRNLMRFASSECTRLGLEFGTHNSPGWSSTAYPTITPEQSMQKVVFEQTAITGAGQTKIEIVQPESLSGFYRDIVVYAVKDGANPIDIKNMIDLSDKLSGNVLNWTVPEGSWTVFRFGHTTMGSVNGTAPLSGQGLEVDKLQVGPLRDYWNTYPKKLIADAGTAAGKSFIRFEIDSYEHGVQNWSANFREEFIKRRGYDPLPFLVTLAGKKVQSAAYTNRFQYDQRQTLRELFETNYFAEMQRLTHQVPGMQLMIEPYSTGKEQPFESNNASAWGDLHMCEFWQKPTTWGWDSVKPTVSGARTWGKNLVAAESFTGQPNSAWKVDPYLLKSTGDRAFAEGVNKLFFHTSAHQPWNNVLPGMTMGQWGTHFGRTQTWWTNGGKEWIAYLSRCQYLLQLGRSASDLCYLVYDRITPPRIDGFECDTIGTDALLQRMTVKNKKLILPNGLSYSVLVLPEDSKMRLDILTKIRQLIKDGATIVGFKPAESPSLTNYPECDVSVKTMAGEIWGEGNVTDRPFGEGRVYAMPVKEALNRIGLQQDLQQIAHSGSKPLLWIHRVLPGDQHIYFLSNQEDVMVKSRISFRISSMLPELWHAETGKTEKAVFWRPNSDRTEMDIDLPASGSVFIIFRKKYAKPEFVKNFNAPQPTSPRTSFVRSENDGLYLMGAEKGHYDVELSTGKKRDIQVMDVPAALSLSNDWQLEFRSTMMSPQAIVLPKLVSWTELTGDLKYFSGTATYSKTVVIPAATLKPSIRCFLDLGEVKNTARIKLNGKVLDVLWAPPFNLDVTDLLRAGANTLEIQLTNLWANRLIGDEQYPDDVEWTGPRLAKLPEWVIDGSARPSKDRKAFATYKFFNKTSPLLISGLVGPVSIYFMQKQKV